MIMAYLQSAVMGFPTVRGTSLSCRDNLFSSHLLLSVQQNRFPYIVKLQCLVAIVPVCDLVVLLDLLFDMGELVL